jgi:transcriptional regulator with XRE-family HTH domain
MSETFSEILKRIRTDRGLSQRQVAIKYGVLQGKEHGATTSLIAAWEYGARQPSRKTIDLLAEALHLTPAEHDELLMAAGFMPEHSKRSELAILVLKDLLPDEAIGYIVAEVRKIEEAERSEQ